MMTAPSSIPRIWAFKSKKSRTLSRKPRKMASPPMRGMGWSCMRRPSLGTSTALTRMARFFTTGVATRATTRATTRAAATMPMRGRSRFLGMGICSLSYYRARKPTFL